MPFTPIRAACGPATVRIAADVKGGTVENETCAS